MFLARHWSIGAPRRGYNTLIILLLCKRRFSDKDRLLRHTRWHAGEKLYNCTVCGKECNRGGDLRMHMRVHTGEKPYMCEICGKLFARNHQLKNHVKTHSELCEG